MPRKTIHAYPRLCQYLVDAVHSIGRCNTIKELICLRVVFMIHAKRSRLSPTEKNDIWSLWKSGQSLHEIWARLWQAPSFHPLYIVASRRDCSSSPSSLSSSAHPDGARGHFARDRFVRSPVASIAPPRR